MGPNPTIPQDEQQKIPMLLKALCYFIIIKSGVKVLNCLIFLIAGDSLKELSTAIGFDTVSNGGIQFQLIEIGLGCINIWAGLQMLMLKRIGIYLHVAVMFIVFVIPTYFSDTYQFNASRIMFLVTGIALSFYFLPKMKA